VSRPPVFGDFLRSAGDHITAATSFRSELPYTAQLGALRHLDRLVAALTRYLTDLPAQTHHIYGPEHDAGTRITAALLALDHVTQSLRPAAAADTSIADAHPAVSHLSAAADHLTAGRDLLHTHFASDPDRIITASSYWAPLITSGPVTSALLADLAAYLDALAPWITTQDKTRHSRGTLTSAHLALRHARPWIQAAATAIQATGRAHYPLPERHLLDAIPANAPPPRQPPAPGEPVHELCQRIPLTAERLRYAAFTYAPHARWSPTATSAAWRKDALASAITAHASEFILRTLAERGRQLGLEPAFRQQLDGAAEYLHQASASWRTVTSHFDILTTGHKRTPATTPVAAEISDLVQRTGQLAYASPHWTPARAHTSPIRDPASLAASPADITGSLAAVHQAIDVLTRITTEDHQAIGYAVDDDRLYIPTRLLPDNYDIPQPYTLAPRGHTQAILAAYDTALQATIRSTTALDDLATVVNAPSRALAAARRAATTVREYARPFDQRESPEHHLVTRIPGRTEMALRKLRIRDPALLLRAAVIDQAARDLVAEATTKARSRASVTARSRQRKPRQSTPPARTASQDTPLLPNRPVVDSPSHETARTSASSPPVFQRPAKVPTA
jgi:hypothetical protein